MDETAAKPAEPPQPLLTVYTFDRDHRQYSFVSFATKLHFRLRHAGIPWADGAGSRGEAPKDKIPYVRFLQTGNSSLDGRVMGDTALVTRTLVAEGRMVDLNAALAPEERARDFCLRSMVEDRMYYLMLYERWNENYATMRDAGPFAYVPWGPRHVVAAVVFRFARLMLYFQGTGRHARDEIAVFRAEAVGALGDLAAAAREKSSARTKAAAESGRVDGQQQQQQQQPFWILGGEAPTEADFTVFGYLAGMLATPTQPATSALIKESIALVDYVSRIHNAYFPDFKSPF